MIGKIIKWDLKRIFSSKKFTVAFILQFLLIVLIVPLFSLYLETLQSGKFFSTAPGMREFIPIGISQDCQLLENIEEHDQFDTIIVERERGMEMLHQGKIVAYIFVDPQFDEKLLVLETIDVRVYYGNTEKSYVANSYLDSIIDGFSDGLRTARVREHNIESVTVERRPREDFALERKDRGEKEENREEEEKGGQGEQGGEGRSTEEETSNENDEMITIRELKFSLNREYIILLIMFLPLFMSGGLLTDSVVSEKEKKTGEMLLVLPTKRRNIILGKMLAVFLVTVTQIVLWILVFFAMGKIGSLYTIFPLILAAFFVISLSLLISVYSQNYKESALLVTVSYVIIFAFMFGASILYISQLKSVSLLSPLSMVIGLEEGSLTIMDTLYSTLPVLSLSFLCLALSAYLFKKDSFYFGPRPGILDLIPDVLSKIGRGNVASLALGLLSLFGAMAVEVILGFFLYFFFSIEMAVVILFIAAVGIEEYLKYLAMSPNRSKFSGAFVGAGFGLAEAFISGVTLFTMLMPGEMILLRILPLFVHTASSGTLGYFRNKGRTKEGFIMAFIIHLVYNTAVVVSL